MDGANRTVGREQRRTTRLRWPDKLLGPPPGMKEINLACWVQFIALLCFFLFLFGAQIRNQSGFLRGWHCGFIYFYGIGQIVNEYPSVRIYDYSLQQKTFNGINPAPEGFYGPSPYPPFVALFFSLFARLPFNWAYVFWAVTSLALYIAGIGATLRGVFPREPLKHSLIFCLALEFCPFILYTLVNGQLATIAVASVGLAIFQENQSKPFRSGLALALLAYKPTLLVLIIPMLLLTRRFKAFSGFAAGTAVLGALATAFFGIQIWPAYARFLTLFGHVAGLNGNSGLNLSKYIDCSSFSYLVPGGRSGIGLGILISVTVTVAASLAILLWRSATSGRPAQTIAWAATLTWTLLLNVYVPIYDSILVVIAIVLTLGALKELKGSAAMGWFILLSVLIFAVSWGTVGFARSHRIQLLSILFGVLGVGQLFLLYRAIREKPMQSEDGLLAE
jgi:alpha-1,2-mannosyltransferase